MNATATRPPDPGTNLLRTPPIPAGRRQLGHDERTLTHDQIWDLRGSQWIEIGPSFIGLRAGTFTCVTRSLT